MNTQPVTISPHVEQRRTLQRPTYRPGDFRNREDILRGIAEQVRLLQQGREIKNSLILAWGVQGVGKSWLLQHLEHQYRFIAPRNNSNKGVFTLYTDFRAFEPGPGVVVRLLAGFVDSLQDRLSADIFFPHAAVERFRKQQTTASDDRILAETFTSILESLSARYVPVGLFDAFDTLQARDEAFFSWFEQWILAPWLQRDRSLVVLSSRRELRQLRQFEVRRRITRVALTPFDRNATIKQLGDEAAGTTLYPMTFGHPLTTWYVHEELDANRRVDQPFDQAFVDTRRDEVAELLEQVIEFMLLDAPVSLRPRIMAAATLRAFHIDSLREILASIERDPDLSNESDVYIQAIIEEFVRSNLVRWSMQKRAYEVDDTVRRLVNRALELKDLDEYVYRHERAYEVYRKRIADTPWSTNADIFIVEAIYHLAEIVRAQPSRQGQMEERFAALLNHAFAQPPDAQRIDTLDHLLDGDETIQELAPKSLLHLLESQFPRSHST